MGWLIGICVVVLIVGTVLFLVYLYLVISNGILKDAKDLYKYSKPIVFGLAGLFVTYEALSIYRQMDENFSKLSPIIRAYDLMKGSQFLQPWYIDRTEASFRDSSKRHYDAGMALFNQKKWEDALKELQLARQLDPRYDNDFDLCVRVGYAALQVPGKEEEALDIYNMAVRLDPRNKGSWLSRGVALERLGKLEEALSCYNKALQIDPAYKLAQDYRTDLLARMAYNKGVKLYEQNDWEGTLREMRSALEIDPKIESNGLWFRIAYASGELGRYQEAIECYDKALKFDPNDKGAWNNRGWMLDRLGKLQEALYCYLKALQIDPKYETAQTNRVNVLKRLSP